LATRIQDERPFRLRKFRLVALFLLARVQAICFEDLFVLLEPFVDVLSWLPLALAWRGLLIDAIESCFSTCRASWRDFVAFDLPPV
jgi:hypothetical protein